MIQQVGVAVAAGAAGLILLLLVGTQILDWGWPLALGAVAFGAGAYRVMRQVLSEYKVAQMLDRLLALQDRLSTSYYFRHLAPSAPEAVSLVERQARERVTPGDVDRAMPYGFPRSGYMAGALTLAALGLFGIRYGVLKTMSLERPLARIGFDTFRGMPKVEAASAKKSVIQEHLEKQLQQLGMSLDDPQAVDKSGEKPSPTNVEAVADEPGGKEKGTPGKGPNPASEGTEESKSDDQSGNQSAESKEEGGGKQSDSSKGQQKAAANPKNAPKNSGNNPGVLDKMKDALANLLNKLGAQQPKSEDAANQSQQQGGQQQASQQGKQGQGKSQGDNQQSPDQQGGKESDAADKSASQQQRASQQDSNKSNENSKSGMGKSDGDKTIQDAEQLAAMGKISEIFGKRAAEIQGEMSVEVPSGKQQLKTAYSRNSATHAGAVADSNRNEIPLMYQTYVQRYFEEVRKAAGSAAKPKTATP